MSYREQFYPDHEEPSPRQASVESAEHIAENECPEYSEEQEKGKTPSNKGEDGMMVDTSADVTNSDTVYTNAVKREKAIEDDPEREKYSGFCCQLGITIKRSLILQSRDPSAWVCELIIPIIFVIGSVILWAIFGNSKFPDLDYFSADWLVNSTTFYSSIPLYMCYNTTLTGGVAIGALTECSTLAAMMKEGDRLLCSTAITGAPIGVCGVASAIYSAYAVWKDLVANHSSYIPTLDELIPLQWTNRILYESVDLKTIWDKTDDSAVFSTGSLYFAPNTTATQNLVAHLQNTSVYFPYVYKGTYSVAEAESLVKSRTNHDPPIWGIVQPDKMSTTEFNVSIRLNASALPKTKKVLVQNYVGGVAKNGVAMYTFSGFLTLQKMVYDYYTTSVNPMNVSGLSEVIGCPAPTKAYKQQKFLANANQLAPLIIVLGFLYPVSQMTKRIVLEKELRLREAMLIMGLSEAVMYTSWLIIYFVQFTVVSLIMAGIQKGTYLSESNFGFIFFLLFFFCLSIISMSGLVAAFFNKARLAAILSPLIYFVVSIPLFAMQDARKGARTGVSFLSPSGFAVGLSILFSHELEGGMRSSDLNYFRDKPSMLVVIAILFVDFVSYGYIMLYLDAVLPKEWGTRKHPLFFILDPINYCRKKHKNYENPEDGRAEDGVFEPIQDEEAAAIRIVGLKKVYGSGKKKFVAVNNLHWCMREGEISVLLGHNGAGKSTTMNMMTGMVSADAGDCYIYGKSVRRDLKHVRQEIGFCPQHNILWPDMTCKEHLWYYSSIKGLRGERREAVVNRLLNGVDLQNKEKYLTKHLSGGQKRKLSVAIAFVCESRLIFLDEPTAGMDVGARRHTWGLLREMAVDHSILLTTHYMDEADLLGDSVAIMSNGSLRCSGSNLYLKSQMGAGYVLTMSVVKHVNRAAIASLVHEFVPEAQSLGTGAGEVSFRLPLNSDEHFPELLASLEDERATTLGINAFSMSATTLEEIFLNIAIAEEKKNKAKKLQLLEEKKAKKLAKKNKKKNGKGAAAVAPVAPTEPTAEEEDGEEVEQAEEEEMTQAQTTLATEEADTQKSAVWNVELMTSENQIWRSQFKSLMYKRFCNSLRDHRTQFFQIICPVLCVLLAMLLMLVKLFQSPEIILTSNLYETDVEIDQATCTPTFPYSSLAHTYEPPNVTTAKELSAFMLQTYSEHPLGYERYGGLVCSDASVGSATVFYNASGLHSAGIGLYNLYNSRFTTSKGSDALQLTTVVNVMPKTLREKDAQDSIYAMMIAIIIMIPFTFIPSTFVAWIVKEKASKARHLQSVSGLYFSMYWLTNFLFDIASYIITMFLVIIVFVIFNRKEYIAPENAGATIVLFFLYGLSGVAMAYALSFLFKEHASAQNTVMLANFIAGFLLVLCISVLSIIDSTKNVAKILRWIFRVVPSYCVGEGISNLAILRMQKALGSTDTAWSMNVVSWPIIYMAIELPFFVFITIFVDHPGRRQRSQRLFHRPDATPEVIEGEDEDVVKEREEVLYSEERKSDLVDVKYLRKVYGNGKVAVRNVTFGVKPGEVFGFLGTNGAGKTTTISILCQEFYPTSGYASICGNDIVEQSREALRYIGYCPQFDATLDLLTPEEHLWMYAGIRGVAYKQRESVVEGLLKMCELTPYRKTLAHRLSGGNRRKLSVAIALIGGPRVVFLDEPSAGMDPVARRGLWNAIEAVADNCSVVLTTHHLEEVEAVAHRVAIMVEGTLECIGNKTHLKKKFGTGFEVNIRVSEDSEEVRSSVTKFFDDHFEGNKLVEYRARRFTFELPGTTKLSQTFKFLQENQKTLHITDYNVSQTSIEQVFLQISEEAERKMERELEERIEKKQKCCSCCTCCACCA